MSFVKKIHSELVKEILQKLPIVDASEINTAWKIEGLEIRITARAYKEGPYCLNVQIKSGIRRDDRIEFHHESHFKYAQDCFLVIPFLNANKISFKNKGVILVLVRKHLPGLYDWCSRRYKNNNYWISQGIENDPRVSIKLEDNHVIPEKLLKEHLRRLKNGTSKATQIE